MSLPTNTRGFLPTNDPLAKFPSTSQFVELDELGRDLPSLLKDSSFRKRAERLMLPPWIPPVDPQQRLPQLRLYYVRIGFLASAYINQVGQPVAHVLPYNLAKPLCHACALLSRPPILSYDGYALYNWKRFNPDAPIALGNIDTIQNFVHLYDEHWFILVHVEIEAIAVEILLAVEQIARAAAMGNPDRIDQALGIIGKALWRQVDVLRRIPEQMDPGLYYKTFRPYIRFFEHVVYEGIEKQPLNFRGETGAQSSIMPMLVALMKIPHQRSLLTDHLTAMRQFMPPEHREILTTVERIPDIRPVADKGLYNNILEAIAIFREVHYGFAYDYIHKHVSDPRGTGGTPFMQWLSQLIDETRKHKIP